VTTGKSGGLLQLDKKGNPGASAKGRSILRESRGTVNRPRKKIGIVAGGVRSTPKMGSTKGVRRGPNMEGGIRSPPKGMPEGESLLRLRKKALMGRGTHEKKGEEETLSSSKVRRGKPRTREYRKSLSD